MTNNESKKQMFGSEPPPLHASDVVIRALQATLQLHEFQMKECY